MKKYLKYLFYIVIPIIAVFLCRILKIALRNTGILIAFALIFQIGISLLLAVCVDSARRGFKAFRTIYFFPVVISATAIGLMFSLIYKYVLSVPLCLRILFPNYDTLPIS